jgi:hypothetical protein
MPTYKVQIEIGAQDGRNWQAVTPIETVEFDGTAIELAKDTAYNQEAVDRDVAEWRVLVWYGDWDTNEGPACTWYHEDGDA